MTDYAVKITVRNGRILRRMRERGIHSLRELAEKASVSYSSLAQLVGLKRPPLGPNGEWKYGVENVAGALFCDPEDLFSEAQMTMALKRNSAEVSLDDTAIARLSSGDTAAATFAKIQVDRLLEAVPTDRAKDIVLRLAGGETLETVAREYKISTTRLTQISRKAHRQMRARAAKFERDANITRRYGLAAPSE